MNDTDRALSMAEHLQEENRDLIVERDDLLAQLERARQENDRLAKDWANDKELLLRCERLIKTRSRGRSHLEYSPSARKFFLRDNRSFEYLREALAAAAKEGA